MKNYHKFQSLFSLLFLFISISSFSSDLDIKSNTIVSPNYHNHLKNVYKNEQHSMSLMRYLTDRIKG